MSNKLPTLAPSNMTEAIEFSKMIAGSGMVPAQYKNKPQDILVAIQWGYELNIQPLQALQNIAVINGKPSIYGDAALALVKSDPRCLGVTEYVEGEGDNRTAYCIAKRKYGTEVEETKRAFSVADAKQARLWGRSGPWSQYPDRMLAMRARGFALRDAFPDALKGVITAEEAQDYPSAGKPVEVVAEAPANPLDRIAKPDTKGIEAMPEVVSERKTFTDDYGDQHDVVDVVEEEVPKVAVELEPVEPVEPVADVPREAPIADKPKKKLGRAAQALADAESMKKPVYKLMHWDGEKEHGTYNMLPEWIAEFKKVMIKYYDRPTVPERERMTKLRQLREANQAVLEALDKADQGRIKDHYLKLLSKLGAANG